MGTRSFALIFALTVCFVERAFAKPAEFKSVPTTVKTTENDTVLLPCYTLGKDEGARIRWYRNDQLLVDSSLGKHTLPERINFWPNGSLEVEMVRKNDTAEYTCEATNSHTGLTVKQHHAIEVLYPPSVEAVPNTGLMLIELGTEVRMLCEPHGVPLPIITWYFKGKELQPADNRQMLKFDANSRLLSGEYECVAANGVGEPARAKIELSVIYPPEVQADKKWSHSSPGLRTQLECIVRAEPPPRIEWLKGNMPVHIGDNMVTFVRGETHALVIQNVRVSDFGIYTCRASNRLGHAEDNIQLSGVANPAVFKKIEKKSETTFTLVWEVDSYSPIIDYRLQFRQTGEKWKEIIVPAEKRGGPLHSQAYTISGLKDRTLYESQLVSRNRFGLSMPSTIVRFGSELTEELANPELTNDLYPTQYSGFEWVSSAPQASSNHKLSALLCLLLFFALK